MSNPLMGMIGGTSGNNQFGMIQKMMGFMRGAQNPGAMLQNMAQSNPNIKKAMDMCQGRNPKWLLRKWECDVSERYITT